MLVEFPAYCTGNIRGLGNVISPNLVLSYCSERLIARRVSSVLGWKHVRIWKSKPVSELPPSFEMLYFQNHCRLSLRVHLDIKPQNHKPTWPVLVIHVAKEHVHKQ